MGRLTYALIAATFIPTGAVCIASVLAAPIGIPLVLFGAVAAIRTITG